MIDNIYLYKYIIEYYIMLKSFFILLIILILFYMYLFSMDNIDNEEFMVYWSGANISPYPISKMDNYPNWPFWNMRFGQTSNMSYDLRGDPLIIPKYPLMWNYSTLTPIYNKSLC